MTADEIFAAIYQAVSAERSAFNAKCCQRRQQLQFNALLLAFNGLQTAEEASGLIN